MLKFIKKYIFFVEFKIHKSMMHDKLKRYQSYFKGNIIDVGAGDQPYRNFFSDVSKYVATNTKSHYKDNADSIEKFTDIWIKDASVLPFINGETDGVLCLQVLSVIQKPDLFFKEAERILKPGGKLLLTTDFLYPTWSKYDHARYSVQHLKLLAKNAGFKVLKTESFGGIKSLFFSLLSRRIRSYPERIKSASSIFSKFCRIITFFLLLLFLPFISLSGYIIYLIDKNNYYDFDFTFNLLLLAEKPF